MKDTEFMSAIEKEAVLKQWITFVRNFFKWENFTDKLYKHLSLHCSFIAHYDRRGFYQTYFVDPDDTIRFLKQFDKDFGCKSVEYGWSIWLDGDYSDINKAMCETIEPYKKRIYELCSRMETQRDISCAKALLEKHGIKMQEIAG